MTINRTSPIDGPVSHTYVDRGDRLCFCGMERNVGLHVCPNGCGHPIYVADAVKAKVAALLAAAQDLHDYIESGEPL